MTSQIPNYHVPEEGHSSLTTEVREIWSMNLIDMKAFILRGRNGSHNEMINKHSKDTHKPVKPPSFNPNKFTKASLH